MLYRLTVQRAIDWYGETAAHAGYLILGLTAFVAGILFVLAGLR